MYEKWINPPLSNKNNNCHEVTMLVNMRNNVTIENKQALPGGRFDMRYSIQPLIFSLNALFFFSFPFINDAWSLIFQYFSSMKLLQTSDRIFLGEDGARWALITLFDERYRKGCLNFWLRIWSTTAKCNRFEGVYWNTWGADKQWWSTVGGIVFVLTSFVRYSKVGQKEK